MLINAIRQNSLILSICALVTALLLASTYLSTKDRIAEAERAAAEKALLEIVPADRHTNDLLLDTREIPTQFWATLGVDKSDNPKAHIARNGDQPVAIIITTFAPDGYNGDIHMLLGINTADGSIAGVRVIRHRETPGLGDKVDTNKSDWVFSFNGKSLGNPPLERWKVRKDGGDFDQFTGATITPRAIVHQIARALLYFEEDKHRLLQQAVKTIQPVTTAAEADHG